MKAFYYLLGAGLIELSVCAQNSSITGKTEAASPIISTDRPQLMQEKISSLNKISTVLGMPVQDSSGKTVGKVQDFVVDLENSKLAYAVLALESNRLVPVPVTALKPAETKDHFVLNMNSALLAAAPGVASDDWPAVDAFAVGGPAGTETGQGKSSEASSKAE